MRRTKQKKRKQYRPRCPPTTNEEDVGSSQSQPIASTKTGTEDHGEETEFPSDVDSDSDDSDSEFVEEAPLSTIIGDWDKLFL